MHKRNRLYVAIGLIYGLLALVRLIAPTLMPGNAPLAHDHLVTGEAALRGLREWIDRYGVQCMRCAE